MVAGSSQGGYSLVQVELAQQGGKPSVLGKQVTEMICKKSELGRTSMRQQTCLLIETCLLTVWTVSANVGSRFVVDDYRARLHYNRTVEVNNRTVEVRTVEVRDVTKEFATVGVKQGFFFLCESTIEKSCSDE
jgi:hypothetical protein